MFYPSFAEFGLAQICTTCNAVLECFEETEADWSIHIQSRLIELLESLLHLVEFVLSVLNS